MAFKLVALFRSPEGGEGADNTYDRHKSFLKELPGAQGVKTGTVTGSPKGESPFSMIVEVYFADAASGQKALSTPEVRAKGQSLFSGPNKIKLMFVEDDDAKA